MRAASLFVFAILLLPACSADQSDKLGVEGELCHIDIDCREPLSCRSGVCSDGGSDGSCTRDSDCGDRMWCADGVCRDDDTNNGLNNGGLNNGFNNGDFNNGDRNNDFNNGDRNNGDFNNGRPNNGIPPDPVDPLAEACRELCNNLDDCDFGVGPECEGQCRDEFGFDPDVVECLAGLSCRELETGQGCFDDGPDPGPTCGDGICDRGERRSCPEDCGGDDNIQECYEACDYVISCDEFIERCGADIADQVLPACFDACGDPGAREQIIQAGRLSCEQVVPLAIEGFGLTDVCE